MATAKPEEIVFLVRTLKEGGYEATAQGYGITLRGASAEAVRGAVRDQVRAHFAKSGGAPGLIRLTFVDDQRFTVLLTE